MATDPYQLMPPLRDEEYKALEADIRRRGVLVPIEKDESGAILDGHNRAEIAARLGIECPVITRTFATEQEKREHVLKINLARRHLDAIRWGLAFSALLQERGGGNGPGRPKKEANSATLAELAGELGVAPRTAEDRLAKARAYESLPQPLREEVDKTRDGMTLSQARRVMKREATLKALEEKAAQAATEGDQGFDLVCGDCTRELRKLKRGSVRLAFADPPYNQGVNYGEGPSADLLPEAEYLDWCRLWMRLVAESLAPDGSFWVLISDGYADRFAVLLREVGLHRKQWLIWYESFGVNHHQGFGRSSRHLLWYVKDPESFVFHETAVLRPSDRELKYGDKRAQPGGRTWDSVWGINPPIPRLVDNAAERLPGFPTQLPLALLRPIVGCASDPGDLVVDPFSGSGTTGAAALALGRRYVGIEKSEEFARLARLRLRSVRRDLHP